MPRPPIKTHPGREMRGFRFRLYTTTEQDLVLRDYAERMKRAWNWLCSRARDVANAREAYAARYHAVLRPTDGATAEDWRAYRAAVRAACKGVDAVSYRYTKSWAKHFGLSEDHLFERACGINLPVEFTRALLKDYAAALSATKRGQAPPRHKRQHDHVTLRVRSGQCLRLRAVGPRPKSSGRAVGRLDWLNCEIHLPRIGWIPGHIGTHQLPLLESEEYWVAGVSVVEETDGWYAAIRQWVVPRPRQAGPSPDSRWRGYGLPAGTHSPVSRGDTLGIDAGLVNLVSIAGAQDELQSGNTRTAELLERIAGRHALELPVGKLQTQAARRVQHLLRGVEAWIREADPVAVAIEDGEKQDDSDAGPADSISEYIAQNGHGRKLGRSKDGRTHSGYVPGAGWLLARIADLTREVSREGTSQTCSHCGTRDKSCLVSTTREFRCRTCGAVEDRDIGAARNLRSKLLNSQDPSADRSQPQHGSA